MDTYGLGNYVNWYIQISFNMRMLYYVLQ